MTYTVESPPHPSLTARQRWTLIVSCVAVALVVASMAALYTALPDMAVATGATQGQLTWVIDGYTLALACLVLSGGALGDRYGRRATLFVGLLVFTVGSAIPLLIHDPVWLISARAVSGVGAALVMPSTLSILTAGLPAARWGRAVGIWAGVVSAGALVGLLGSGLAVQGSSWKSIFVGLTVAGVALAAAALTVPESHQHERPRMDVGGALVSALAVGLLVAGLIEAPERGWLSPITLALLGGGLIAAAAFVVVELRGDHPLLPVRLFGDRAFATGVVSLTLQYLASFGLFLLVPQYLQLILGYAPVRAAVAVSPMSVPLLVLCALSSRLTARLGLRVMTASGLATFAVGLILMSRLDVHTGYIGVLWPVLIVGAGLGLCTAPATSAVITGTPAAKHGVASAVNDATREIGAAIGIAVAGSVLAAGYRTKIEPALSGLPEPVRRPVSDSLAAALAVTDRTGPSARPLADLARTAFIHGIQQATLALAAVTAIGAVATLGALGPTRNKDRTG
jgi:EmrB/QacA subfamily drug resistance transporter